MSAKGKMIYIGSDHAGFEMKQAIKDYLKRSGYEFEDVGPETFVPDDDYPDFAKKVCYKVLANDGVGILMCGSGQGMSITANRIKGIRAALSWNEESARLSRLDLDSNVLCFGGRLIPRETAEKIVETWLTTEFSGASRHVRRIKKIDEQTEEA